MALKPIEFHTNGYPRYVSVSRVPKLGLKPITRTILEKLIQKCNKRSQVTAGEVQINYRKLAHELGYHYDTVRKHIKILRDRDLILMSHVFIPGNDKKDTRQEGSIFKLNLEHFFFNPSESDLVRLRAASRPSRPSEGRVVRTVPPVTVSQPPLCCHHTQKIVKNLKPLEALKSKAIISASKSETAFSGEKGSVGILKEKANFLECEEKTTIATMEAVAKNKTEILKPISKQVKQSSLSDVWRKLLPELYEDIHMLPPFTVKENAMMKVFQRALESEGSIDPLEALKLVLMNWGTFINFGGVLDGNLWKYTQAKAPTLTNLAMLAPHAVSFYHKKVFKKAAPAKTPPKKLNVDLPKVTAPVPATLPEEKPMTLEELEAMEW